jgi:tRNA-intron endonuclease
VENPYLWFYEKPTRPCSHIVAIYSRNQNIPLNALEGLLISGGRFKKGVYLALVDEEGEVSYYEIKRFNMRSSIATEVDRRDVAQLVGPMTVVWDTKGAVSLYREGYFGKPIGIRKPRSMDFERPITLSYNESIYLAEKGRISIQGEGGEMESGELRESAANEKNFEERSLVYDKLKESGFVVKSGMKFGVDFAVYEYGPGLDHAPFLIHVFTQGSSITPTEIVRAGRLAASVKKKFIVAQADCETGKVGMLSFSRVKP